jgi:hypothetical protein
MKGVVCLRPALFATFALQKGKKLMIRQSHRTFLAAFVVCGFLPVSIWTQTTPDTIECGKIVVKDYPLPALVQTLFKTCNKQILYTENLPEIKVTLNHTGTFPVLLDWIGTRTNVVFQPALLPPGQFREGSYEAGKASDLTPGQVWFVSQTGAQTSLVAGKSRVYLDPISNRYQVMSTQASVKELLDRLSQLLGEQSPFTADLVADLARLGLDLAGNAANFKATLTLHTDGFHNAFRTRLTQALYRTWLEQNDEVATDVWPLTFIGGRGRITPTGATTPPANDDADESLTTVQLLNQIFGADTVRLSRQSLYITGNAETRVQVKRLLARIDAPWPQVQMNLWTIQVSGRPDKIGDRLLEIKTQLSRTKDQMANVHHRLNALLAANSTPCNGDCEQAKRDLEQIGFRREVNEALSLNEALILLAIQPNRSQLLNTLGQEVGLVLPRMRRVYSEATRQQAIQGIRKLSLALATFRSNTNDPRAPTDLQRESGIVDRLLKSAIDAYSADLEEELLHPLLLGIQRLNGGVPKRSGWNDEGVTLTGRARLVVTSRLSAVLEPTLKYYANVSRPKPYDVSVLNKAFPNNTDGKAAPRVPLLDLETLPALLLAAGLAEQEPVFSEVAPGVKIFVRPTVHPDGSNARLEFNCSFGVTTAIPAQQANDIWGQAKADAIESHRVSTDASIGVFDLFDISSFSIESSHPQAPYYIPVLGRLPIIGPAFQFPRDKKRVHQESIVLVNTTILPCALDLTRYYGDY